MVVAGRFVMIRMIAWGMVLLAQLGVSQPSMPAPSAPVELIGEDSSEGGQLAPPSRLPPIILGDGSYAGYDAPTACMSRVYGPLGLHVDPKGDIYFQNNHHNAGALVNRTLIKGPPPFQVRKLFPTNWTTIKYAGLGWELYPNETIPAPGLNLPLNQNTIIQFLPSGRIVWVDFVSGLYVTEYDLSRAIYVSVVGGGVRRAGGGKKYQEGQYWAPPRLETRQALTHCTSHAGGYGGVLRMSCCLC